MNIEKPNRVEMNPNELFDRVAESFSKALGEFDEVASVLDGGTEARYALMAQIESIPEKIHAATL